jgi:NitT/TauT family transport system permease protein
VSGALRVRRGAPGLVALALILGAWFAVKYLAQPSDTVLPTPVSVAEAAWEDRSTLWSATRTTLVGALGGFVVGNLVGILGALAVAASATAARVVLPMALMIRVIPVIALAPFLTLALGQGTGTIVAISALLVFFPTLINGVLGLRSVRTETLELMSVMNASRWEVFRRVRARAALPHLFAAFQVGAPACILGAMVAEWVTSSEGLGFLILQSGVQFDVELMWAGGVVATLLGLFAFGVTGRLARHYTAYLESP